MKHKNGVRKAAIRYSEAFKMAVIREVEESGETFARVTRKYGLGAGSVQHWARKYGHDNLRKVIRVETPKEIDERKQLKKRVQALEKALADAHMDLDLERAYTRLACKQAGITDVVAFKKKRRWFAVQEAVKATESEPTSAEAARTRPTVSALCAKVGMSRQNYYAQRRVRQKRKVNADLVEQLVVMERRQQSRLGGRKLHHMVKPALAEANIKLGRDRFCAVLRERDLLVPPLPKQYPRTTQVDPSLPVFRNEIKGLQVSAPNEVWVADITYVRTQEGYLYLALVTDQYSRKIVGHHAGESLLSEEAMKAVAKALRDLPPGMHPYHHSDRGCQYCCKAYVKRLQARGIKMSMTEKNHCAENAMAERVNGILKQEYGLGAEFKTKAMARQAIEQAIYLYNYRRPHRALGYQVPNQVHEMRLAA